MTSIGKAMGKQELPCTVSGNVNMHSFLGEQFVNI